MPPATQGERQYPSASRGWWAVCVFAIAALLSYTDRQILALLVDPLRADLHISDMQVSILQGAAFAVLYSFIGLPLGRIADLVPRRALLLFAVILWSIGTIVCGYSHSFGQLFAARLLVGIGEAALAPAAMSLIGDYFPASRRALPTGVFLAGMLIGGGAAFAIGGFLLSAAQYAMFHNLSWVGVDAPWRQVLFVLGLAGLIVTVLFLTLFEPAGRRVSFADIRARLTSFDDVVHLYKSQISILLPLYAAMAVGSIADYAILSWMPALLSRRFAMTSADIGVTLGGVAMIAGLAGTILGGVLADWISARFGLLMRIRVCGAFIIAGALAAPIGILGSPATTLASAFVWLLISSLTGTIGIATTLDLLSAEARGFGTSTISFCNTIVGLGLGPTLVALITERIYGTPADVGMALSTVVTPAIAATCILFFASSAFAQKNRMAIA